MNAGDFGGRECPTCGQWCAQVGHCEPCAKRVTRCVRTHELADRIGVKQHDKMAHSQRARRARKRAERKKGQT